MAQAPKDALRPATLQRSKSRQRGTADGQDIGRNSKSHAQPNGTKPAEDAKSPSDEATAAFVRRVLCSHHLRPSTGESSKGGPTPQPLEDLLPPLTSSNEVDLQLYAIIAVIIKEFVQTWYAKITPDHEFVDEVLQIIAHCTRALEQRIRRVDLEALVLDEIPALFEDHVKGW